MATAVVEETQYFYHHLLKYHIPATVYGYVEDTYSKLKNVNKTVSSFVDGVECGVKNIASTTYKLTKNFVPYSTIDKMATNSLEKIETAIPKVKETVNTITPVARFGGAYEILQKSSENILHKMADFVLQFVDVEKKLTPGEKLMKKVEFIALEVKQKVLWILGYGVKPDGTPSVEQETKRVKTEMPRVQLKQVAAIEKK